MALPLITKPLEVGSATTVSTAAVSWFAHALPMLQVASAILAIIVGICTLIGFVCRFAGGSFCAKVRKPQ